MADSNYPEHMVATLLSVGVLRTIFAVGVALLLSVAFLVEGTRALLGKPDLETNPAAQRV